MKVSKFIKKRRLCILAVITLTFLAMAAPALAGTADVSMTTVNTSSVTKLIQTVANVFAAIGAGVILIYGMWHTFGVAGAGKNANKRQMAMESLGYVFLSIFIFFALSGLGGVIRGIAESSFGTSIS